MKSLRAVVVLGAAAALVLGMGAFATLGHAEEGKSAKAVEKPAHEYVGAAGCKMCHSGPAKGSIYETWEKTKHAQAFTNLPAEGQKNPKCFACHTTGFGKPGGFDPAAPTAAKMQNVGCEACHGGGKDYKGMAVMKDKAKAIEAGLIVPDVSTCKGCHEGAVPEGHKERPKFEFATAVKLVEHHVPKK
jgi:hypothetical protein